MQAFTQEFYPQLIQEASVAQAFSEASAQMRRYFQEHREAVPEEDAA